MAYNKYRSKEPNIPDFEKARPLKSLWGNLSKKEVFSEYNFLGDLTTD